jgi:dihydrodipicolinate synthase/N-acetylneuraminate lyase
MKTYKALPGHGVSAALVTPFKTISDKTRFYDSIVVLDADSMVHQTLHVLKNGVRAVLVNGNTGELMFTNPDQKNDAIRYAGVGRDNYNFITKKRRRLMAVASYPREGKKDLVDRLEYMKDMNVDVAFIAPLLNERTEELEAYASEGKAMRELYPGTITCRIPIGIGLYINGDLGAKGNDGNQAVISGKALESILKEDSARRNKIVALKISAPYEKLVELATVARRVKGNGIRIYAGNDSETGKHLPGGIEVDGMISGMAPALPYHVVSSWKGRRDSDISSVNPFDFALYREFVRIARQNPHAGADVAKTALKHLGIISEDTSLIPLQYRISDKDRMDIIRMMEANERYFQKLEGQSRLGSVVYASDKKSIKNIFSRLLGRLKLVA